MTHTRSAATTCGCQRLYTGRGCLQAAYDRPAGRALTVRLSAAAAPTLALAPLAAGRGAYHHTDTHQTTDAHTYHGARKRKKAPIPVWGVLAPRLYPYALCTARLDYRRGLF
jgi:hypothetical protein